MSRDDKLCWYHRDLTRDQSDDLLKSSGVGDGVFLVRDSNTSPGDYVLSVLHKDEVFHYQIRRHGEDAFFSIDDQTPIHGLDSLIEHYQKSPDGLVTQLSSNIPKEPPPAEARRHGRTNLLHRATQKGNLLVVEQKLDAMSNGNKTYPLDAKDQDGRSVVHLACLLDIDNNAEPMLEKLISHGANVNCRDESGNTPLHYASRNKPVSFIKMLLSANANIDARNNDTGRVPLHEAAHNGNFDVVKQLLDLGVPHLPRCCENKTPVQLAKEAGYISTAEYLDKYTPPAPTTNATHWYHGTLSRSESDRAIRKHAKTYHENQDCSGTFLVRFSVRENTYILGLMNDEHELKNYVIQRSVHHYLYIDEGPYMLSLEHLVQHYMRFSDGLPVKLRYPVQPIPKPQLPPPLPPSTAFQTSLTLPHPYKHTKTNKGKSKETDSITTSPETKERNLSLPSDELMNQSSSFLTLSNMSTLPSPAKIGLNSLKRIIGKSKKENKSKPKEVNDNVEISTNLATNDISKSLNVLKFSNDDIYKVPKSIPATDEMSNRASNTNNPVGGVDDLEFFTQSDQQIYYGGTGPHDKDNAIEEIYFVEAPTKSVPISSVPFNYVAFKQTPYFPPPNSTNNAEADTLNGNAVNNNKLNVPVSPSTRSERVLSIESTISNDLDIMLAFQNPSNANRSTATTPTLEAKTLKPNYYIPASSIKLSDVLGFGEFGNVCKGSMKCESQNGESREIPIAVKTLHNEHVKESRIEFLREASVMIKLSHHCIVKMIGVSKGSQGLMIIQELVSLGSLLTYLTEHGETINPNSELKIWASQIACGMHYLQTQHFVHRDLAARNILLSSLHQAKISDFGLSRALGAGNDYYRTNRGGKWPIKWYAPESCNYGTFSHASDVWSFGVTLWEMYSFGMPPYGEMNSQEVIQMIERGDRLPKPLDCPANVYDIMSSCWNYSPKDRPTFRYLTEFFSNDPEYQNMVDLIKTQNIF